jgi:hypothetical protein
MGIVSPRMPPPGSIAPLGISDRALVAAISPPGMLPLEEL